MTREEFNDYCSISNLNIEKLINIWEFIKNPPERFRKRRLTYRIGEQNKTDFLIIECKDNEEKKIFEYTLYPTIYNNFPIEQGKFIKESEPIYYFHWLYKPDLVDYLKLYQTFYSKEEMMDISSAANKRVQILWNYHNDNTTYQAIWIYLVCCNIKDFIMDTSFQYSKKKIDTVMYSIMNLIEEYLEEKNISLGHTKVGSPHLPKGHLFQPNTDVFAIDDNKPVFSFLQNINIEINSIKANYQMLIEKEVI